MYILKKEFNLDKSIRGKIEKDYKKINYDPLKLDKYILEQYNLDINSKYGDISIKNPFGKASGQLSSNINQVKNDAYAGLGFCVLKTVISQDGNSKSEMEEWKVNAPRMVVEKIESKGGEIGYTVTWKGRGWDKSFEDYLALVEKSYDIYKETNMPVIPSVQYHLPMEDEEFKIEEYRYTTKKIEDVWRRADVDLPLIVEQDFSATLSSLKNSEKEITNWLTNVPKLINESVETNKFNLGVKLFNPPLSDDYQVEMLEILNNLDTKIGVLTCFNRLFDFNKTFDGKKGVAYGGYDLSDRNLRVLDKFHENKNNKFIPISATGNINSGRMMVEYALRGATSGQMHTFFQLPSKEYGLNEGTRIQKALHELVFNPDDGLVSTMIYLKNKFNIKGNETFKFLDIFELYKNI